jgi:hypothetical protein
MTIRRIGRNSGRRRAWLVVIGIVSALSLCGDNEPSSAPTPDESSPTVDVFANPTIDDNFIVADDRELALRCWGQGSPTVVLETGHPTPGGIPDFDGSTFVEEIATQTTVCAYDRAGTGASDAAPNKPRSADDVIHDLHALLEAARVDAPYVLVGASFGGMIVTYYTAQYPDEAAGVVLLDVPAPTDELTLKEIPELAWDHPENPEHVDVIREFEGRFARNPVPFNAPLIVVTATQGQSDVKDQGFWLELSPDARQVELDGGHDIWLDRPEEAASEVLRLVQSA